MIGNINCKNFKKVVIMIGNNIYNQKKQKALGKKVKLKVLKVLKIQNNQIMM